MRVSRKTTPKVKDGRVQKKNRHAQTPNYWNTRQSELRLDVKDPGKGYKHFLKKRDILRFLALLPNWEELKVTLDAVILAEGGGPDGWYADGVLAICAWEKEGTVSLGKDYFKDHKELFIRLNLRYEIKKTHVLCHFSPDQIVAYQLLHIMLHELGHHHDRLTTKSGRVARGEGYAEDYAFKYEEVIWSRFFQEFPMV